MFSATAKRVQLMGLLNLSQTRSDPKKNQINQEVLNQILLRSGETRLDESLGFYIEQIRELGFESILEESFQGHYGLDHYYIFWNPKGILLALDSFNSDIVNSSKIYYDWSPRQTGIARPNFPTGTMDAREAIRLKMSEMEKIGVFLNPWKNYPNLILQNYRDIRNQISTVQRTEERISKFPIEIRDMIIKSRGKLN